MAPVIYIFFNRPELMKKSLAAIRAVRPQRLHLVSDGPRANRPDDAINCAEARKLAEALVDWPCEVTRDYSTTNLGAGKRIASALTQAFETHFEDAIIIEDDLVAHPDFFRFCSAALEEHRGSQEIHAISGFNPIGRYRPALGSSVPTLFNDSWGWATWRRAWRGYHFDISEWREQEVQQRIRKNCANDLIFQHYSRGFNQVLSGEVDAWDYQWTYMMFREARHCLATTNNFITNIGFSQQATHTQTAPHWVNSLRTYSQFSTKAKRDHRRPDILHDRLYAQIIMSGSPLKTRIARLIARHSCLDAFNTLGT